MSGWLCCLGVRARKRASWLTILPNLRAEGPAWFQSSALIWASRVQLSASLALEWVQTPMSRKSHSSLLISQVTLNNVEICSENISTLKKTLEVQRNCLQLWATAVSPGGSPVHSWWDCGNQSTEPVSPFEHWRASLVWDHMKSSGPRSGRSEFRLDLPAHLSMWPWTSVLTLKALVLSSIKWCPTLGLLGGIIKKNTQKNYGWKHYKNDKALYKCKRLRWDRVTKPCTKLVAVTIF